jgi:hypothetical protein
VRRADLEHLIRAAADIADDEEVVVIGSQAVLGTHPTASGALAASMEADLYPKNRPERAELIDGTIGEGSPFHATFGYYAQGVAPTTATLPRGWEARLVPVRNANTRGATGWCLDVHDLVISKYVANRPKDHLFIVAAARAGLLDAHTLHERLAATTVADGPRRDIAARIDRDLGVGP